jgi:hypothetical protein
VAFGDTDGVLKALKGSHGQPLWSIDLASHYGRTFDIDHAPVIMDFDGDARLDIFIIGGYGTSSTPEDNHGRGYALKAGEGGGPGWPMFRHDPYHTGYFKKSEQLYLCGDANADELVDVSDAVMIINHVFVGGDPPDPPESGDANCDGLVDVSDAVWIINYVFINGNDPCDTDGDGITNC